MKKKILFWIRVFKKAFIHAMVDDEFRLYIGKRRLQGLKGKINPFKNASDRALTNTISYNLKALNDITTDFCMQRMKWLIYAVLAVETTTRHSSILFIGPRTENEILFLKALGYENVSALDLISYSPYITLGDMHNIPFGDEAFDIVICGWTLPYSKQPSIVAKEIVRVAKKNGLIAVGLEHIPAQKLEAMLKESSISESSSLNQKELATDSLNSVEDIRNLFGMREADQLVFSHNAPLKNLGTQKIQLLTGLGSSQVMVVLRK
jgi:hypothetical protein